MRAQRDRPSSRRVVRRGGLTTVTASNRGSDPIPQLYQSIADANSVKRRRFRAAPIGASRGAQTSTESRWNESLRDTWPQSGTTSRSHERRSFLPTSPKRHTDHHAATSETTHYSTEVPRQLTSRCIDASTQQLTPSRRARARRRRCHRTGDERPHRDPSTSRPFRRVRRSSRRGVVRRNEIRRARPRQRGRAG